jgi:hypothetical protein
MPGMDSGGKALATKQNDMKGMAPGEQKEIEHSRMKH